MDQLPFVAKARKAGFDILEVRAQKIARMSKAEQSIRSKPPLRRRVCGLTYSIGMTDDMDLVSEDAAARKKGIALLQDLCRAMKRMGGAGNGRNQLAIALVRDKWMARMAETDVTRPKRNTNETFSYDVILRHKPKKTTLCLNTEYMPFYWKEAGTMKLPRG